MSKTNVGANLVFALRTKIVCEPMSEVIVSNSFSNIGLIPDFVRRANIRFAPTLVLLIGLIPVFVRGERMIRPTRQITKYILRSTRKIMIVYLRAQGTQSVPYAFPRRSWERERLPGLTAMRQRPGTRNEQPREFGLA